MPHQRLPLRRIGLGTLQKHLVRLRRPPVGTDVKGKGIIAGRHSHRRQHQPVVGLGLMTYFHAKHGAVGLIMPRKAVGVAVEHVKLRRLSDVRRQRQGHRASACLSLGKAEIAATHRKTLAGCGEMKHRIIGARSAEMEIGAHGRVVVGRHFCGQRAHRHHRRYRLTCGITHRKTLRHSITH